VDREPYRRGSWRPMMNLPMVGLPPGWMETLSAVRLMPRLAATFLARASAQGRNAGRGAVAGLALLHGLDGGVHDVRGRDDVHVAQVEGVDFSCPVGPVGRSSRETAKAVSVPMRLMRSAIGKVMGTASFFISRLADRTAVVCRHDPLSMAANSGRHATATFRGWRNRPRTFGGRWPA